MRARAAMHGRELPEEADYTRQSAPCRCAWSSHGARLALLLIAWLALGARQCTARAEAPVVRWRAPPSCPTERDLLEQIAMRLRGRELERQDVLAEGSILLSNGRYNLTLQLVAERQRATRALSASNCKALTDTASWLIAVALAPDLAVQADATRDATPDAMAPSRAAGLVREEASAASTERPSAESERALRAPQVEDTPRVPERAGLDVPARPRPRLRTTKLRFVSVRRQKRWMDEGAEPSKARGDLRRALYASLFAGVFSAGLPAPVSSLGVRLGVEFDRIALQLRGAHMLARTREAGAVSVRFPMQELGTATCAAWGERVRGGPCATLSLVRTTGIIDGASEPRRSVVYWGTAGVSAYLSWLVERPFELSAETGLSLPISARPRFVLDEFGQLERASSLSLYARLGVGVRYP